MKQDDKRTNTRIQEGVLKIEKRLKMKVARERGSPEHPEALALALFYQFDDLIISAYIHLSPLSFLHKQKICSLSATR